MGRMKRDDPAARYLLPANDPDQVKLARITLLALATHTAGLPRIPTNSEGSSTGYTVADLVAALRADGVPAKPGGPASYSNFGFYLLGQSLAAAWGTSYPDALRTQVLGPLGLNATMLAMEGATLPRELARPQIEERSVEPFTFNAGAPGGGLVSSSRELAAFLTFCLRNARTPLRAALAETMKPQQPMWGGRIGLSWFIEGNRFWPVYHHGGATLGYRAYLGFWPARGRGIVVLSNSNKENEPLAHSLLTGTRDTTPPPRKFPAEVPLSAATLGEYEGVFSFSPQFVVTVTAEAGDLFVQGAGQGKHRVFASAKDEFFYKTVEARLRFERDANGKVVAVVLRQNGRDRRGERSE
jgi:serine-type D-Ala-D-Ala carboxypeptidase/endopeptidase